MDLNPTPSPHTIPPTLNMALSHPHMGPPVPGGGGPSNGHPNQMQYTQQYHPQQQGQGQGQQGMLPQGMHMVQLQPGQGQAAFGGVMGAQGPQGGTKVYASVYSGIPVFEAMIRGTSVMRRSSDSWVNATQILKVAGIPKSARTKILEKEILTGLHEKVQGGYGKYQGTWIPFQRGQELAAQYGVTQYLAPIFDFIPSPSNVAALPVARAETPDRKAKNAAAAGSSGYNALLSQTPRPPSTLGSVPPTSAGRVYSPMHPSELPPPPPPQFQTTPDMMLHHQQQQFLQQQMYQSMYYPPPMMPGGRGTDGLGPPVDLNGYGLPPSHSDVYIDQFGQPHSIHFTANGMEPPSKRIKAEPESGLAVPPVDSRMVSVDEDEEPAPVAEAEEDDSDDEMGEKPALPSAMRLSTKPTRPKPSAGAGKARSRLLELFQNEDKVDVRTHLGGSTSLIGQNGEEAELEVDVDTIIDDQGHTALHWASSLAQMDLVRQLVELGADIHRGNYAGETPLMRSVLTTNHSEANTFSDLLTLLGPSIRTLDLAYRSAIHHISLVAGIKGRAGCARGYMAAVLGWIARDQQQQQQQQASTGISDSGHNGLGPLNSSSSGLGLKTLVDVQDVHGDTALNVAARVGNKGLIGLLVEAGADKARANKLGLKPADFGVETEMLKVSPAETVVSNLKSEISRPERHSRDIQKNIGAIFETVNETFTTEMLSKQTKLNAIEASVRHATRALADKRQQVQRAQAALSEIEQIQQRSENVKKSLKDNTMASEGDWTGCSRLSTEQVQPGAFRLSTGPVSGGGGEDIGLPNRGELGALVRLRRMAVWEDRMTALLNDRIQALQGQGADKAVKYRRLVSLCTKVPVEKVDGMLDGLAAAIESDGSSIDLSRISTFMSRVKQDETMGNGTATTA